MPSKEWFYGFKNRNPAVVTRTHEPLSESRSKLMNKTVISNYFKDLGKILGDLNLMYAPDRIWNMNEKNVRLDTEQVSNSRESVTIVVTVNAADKRLQPAIIVKVAWESAVNEVNIKSGFHATGIYPFNPSIIGDDKFKPSLPFDKPIEEEHQVPDHLLDDPLFAIDQSMLASDTEKENLLLSDSANVSNTNTEQDNLLISDSENYNGR
ncbi:hypothetical protein KUTeg_012211 [Tegillarca granosa]|uniref:HTH CENPB-type domain-containing protein n=1 Tax=Tegillarca granosa TaxID=220873 RepID=A0ABQ9F2B5_TEGGR|nr:hypothetical protein KUTeg_012211 [Tegillarca granosa]